MHAYEPSKIVLPSELARREIEAGLMFRRRTIWIVHGSMIASVVGFYLWAMLSRTALLTPIGPNFRAVMIGFGVFLGILVAAVEREAWLLDLGCGRRQPPKGFGAVIAMAVLIAASGFAGNFLAAQLWEAQAFHGVTPARADSVFTVIGRHNSRNGDWLELAPAEGSPAFSIDCSSETYFALSDGDRLVLTVETGRGGVQRVTLPPLRDLRRI